MREKVITFCISSLYVQQEHVITVVRGTDLQRNMKMFDNKGHIRIRSPEIFFNISMYFALPFSLCYRLLEDLTFKLKSAES